MGFHRIGDISRVPLARMEKLLGKSGEHLWLLASGIDDRPVCDEHERKSYSEETTFERDVDDAEVIERVIFDIADRLSYRLRSEGARGKTVTLKIRLQGFQTHTISLTLPNPVSDMETIRTTAVRHFRKFDRKGKRVRLIGIRMSNLELHGECGECQLELFREAEVNGTREHRGEETERVLDRMRDRFGDKVKRATLLHHTLKNE